MARINFLIAVLFFLHADVTSAQFDTTINLQQQNFIEGSYTDFYIDNLNNIYLLTKDNQFKKLNNKDDSVAVSNALKKYGDIYSVDVSNPLKIVVYYKDFSSIIILDRFLSTRNIIDLRRYGILQAQAVAQSYDNNYWVFDAVENKLKKVDDNGNNLLQTPDFRTIFNEGFSPEEIIDNNGFVYLYDAKKGWMIFDYYGAFKQNIPQPNLKNVQVIKNDLYGFDSAQNIHRYNTQTFKETIYHFNTKITGVIKFQLNRNNLFVLANDGLYVFLITY
jgi:hypothetical protein